MPVDGSVWRNTGTPMAAGGGSQAQNGRLWDSPAEALGCLSLPVMASRRGAPPLRHGEESLLFTGDPFVMVMFKIHLIFAPGS